MTPRSLVVISMVWIGLLVVTSQDLWRPVRDFVEGKTH